MADRKGKKRKKTKSTKDPHLFQLEDVLAVGGDKEDYEMLKDVDVPDDYIADKDTKGETISVNKNEIISFIQELGLDRVQPSAKGQRAENVHESENEDELAGITASKNDLQKKDKISKEEVQAVSESTESHKCDSVAQVGRKRFCDKMLVRPGGRWYDQVPVEEQGSPSASHSDVMYLQKEAVQLWENEVDIYHKVKAKEKSSDAQWLKTVTTSGTLGDKVAGLTVQIQESPVHQMKNLNLLIAMTKKKGRRESLMAIDTLKELWLADLLPEERKLKLFSQHPLSSLGEIAKGGGGLDSRDKRLIMWHFEDLLKQKYADFVSVIERLLHDTLVNIRNKVLGLVFDLLSQRPEQEQVLLGLLVNKVGDPDRKVATKAAHLLRCMVTKHPNMKLVITREVEKLMYRPNINIKAQYYAVCFLNQMILTKRDIELSGKLINIYFSFFKSFIKKGEVETKMLGALLTGVNRAFPYAKEEDEKYTEQLDTLFRTVHIGTFNTSVQALLLLFQVMDSRQSVSDRFYQALYSKLFDPSLKASSKQAMFLNVLYKSLKVDPSLARCKAFVKRLLQVCSFQQPAFVCGVLYLVSELTRLKPGIKSLIQQPEEDDEEEHFVDIPENESDQVNDRNEDTEDKNTTRGGAEGEAVVPKPARQHEADTKTYRPQIRNPLYCGAEHSCVWELIRLSHHYHPSVCVFARTLMKGESIEYTGDPLQDFTLMRFLDRFIYKNPKKKQKEYGGSLMQPKSLSSRRNEEPVNTRAFLAKKEENIREDELFFHRFFKRKAEEEESKNKKKKTKKANEYEDEEDETIDNVQDEQTALDFDFASELRRSKSLSSKKKKKAGSEDEEDEEEGDDSAEDSSGDDFDYGDLDLSAEDEDEDESTAQIPGQKRKFTTEDYEKALLENMSSDEFSDEEEKGKKSKKSKNGRGFVSAGKSDDMSSMFASAEEFAHLLEGSGSSTGGSHDLRRKGASDKQLHWEGRKAAQSRDWKKTRSRRPNQARRKKNGNRK